MSMTTPNTAIQAQPSRRGKRGLLVLLLVVLIACGAGFGIWYYTSRPTPAAAAPADGNPELQKNLTVTLTDMLPAAAQCNDGDVFVRNSLDAPQRRWTDSVSTPFKASAKDSMLKELMNEHCVNPTLLASTIKGLSAITLDGWNVGKHNPWTGEFLAQADKPGLRMSFLTKKENTGNKIFVTTEPNGGLQHYAALTNALLLKLKNTGVITQTSLTNLHLPGGGLVAGELVVPEWNKHQESLPALRLEVTEKGRGCVYAIAFNTGDKRFESLACKVTTKKPTTPGTSITPPSGCKSNCGTPPSTGCKSNCGGRDDSKDWKLNVDKIQGVTNDLGPGKKTDGKESERQKESGQTSGNVIDKPVDPDTRSGDTTSDTGSGVPAGGATQGGGSSGPPPVTDDGNNHDDGGTDGDGEIPPPAD